MMMMPYNPLQYPSNMKTIEQNLKNNYAGLKNILQIKRNELKVLMSSMIFMLLLIFFKIRILVQLQKKIICQNFLKKKVIRKIILIKYQL